MVMFINQIISEIVFIIYTSIILVSHLNQWQISWVLNTVYIVLNIFKFGESFTTAYSIKIIKNAKIQKLKSENQPQKNEKMKKLSLRELKVTQDIIYKNSNDN